MTRAWGIAAMAVVALTGPLQGQQRVRIFAAASLTDALTDVVAEFERTRPATTVVLQFGSSSDLARQILAGAPADVFFSADSGQMERVAAKGWVETESDVLSNQLVIVRHRDAPDTIDGPAELQSLGHLAMADPEAVPAGVYARLYLESQDIWSGLRSKVVPTLDVRGALAAVASGNVDAGFVYRTDAAIERRVKVVYAVPRNEGPKIVYRLGISKDRGAASRALFDYLQSEAAGAVFERFGFVFLP